jgi:spermidine/putrescine transport system ATP-binding protein
MAEGTPAITIEGVTKRFGRVVAVRETSFDIREGEFFTMLGPSGCGKTTTLRMIAGFEQADEGRILLRGVDVTTVPPNRRNVNMVFQHYALFPHMSVADNVAFGLKLKRVSKEEQRQRVQEMLEIVALSGLERRRPSQLSGGQQQRVALARALVNRPAALLLDEPLGALDVKLRKALQLELKRIQHEIGTTFVYVTHDQEEALAMSDRIAVMNDGVVEQIGSPREVYERPHTAFVADFIGSLNALDVTVDELVGGNAVARLPKGGHVVATAGSSVRTGERIKVAVRPEKVRVDIEGDRAPADGSLLSGTVAEVVFLGMVTHVHVDTEAGRMVSHRMNDETVSRITVGRQVTLSWPVEDSSILSQPVPAEPEPVAAA